MKRILLLLFIFLLNALETSAYSSIYNMFDKDEETYYMADNDTVSVELNFKGKIYGLSVVFDYGNYPEKAEILNTNNEVIYKNDNLIIGHQKVLLTFEEQTLDKAVLTFKEFNSKNPIIREIIPISSTSDPKENPVCENTYAPLISYPYEGSDEDIKYVSLTGLMEVTDPDAICEGESFQKAVEKLNIKGMEEYVAKFDSDTTQREAAKLLHNITRLKKDGPTLIFQIDEGIGGGGLHNQYKDNLSELDGTINNMYEAILPLTIKYNVAVLIYPHLNYDRVPKEPIDRIDAALHQTLRFFHDKNDMTVYLELFSSGIGLIAQNGNYITQVMAPLYNESEDEPGRIALSMDLNTLAALKNKYPTIEGVRFHEMFGGITRSINRPGDSKARPFDAELFKAIIDCCKQNKLKIDWGDSSWFTANPTMADDPYPGYIYNPVGTVHKPYYESEPYKSMFDYAEQQLGEDVCFNWNNNNWHFTVNLGFWDSKISLSTKDVVMPVRGVYRFDLPYSDLPFKDRENSGWGISNQSWFWAEYIVNIFRAGYRYGEYAQPIETITAYTMKGIREGAKTVQYEPVEYFFNMEKPSLRNSNPNAVNRIIFESEPDGSANMRLKRHIQQLLDAENIYGPPADIGKIFDRDQQRFLENDISDPPLNYNQTTLGIIGNDYSICDFYSYGNRWQRQDDYRFLDEVYDADKVIRMDIQGDGMDEVVAVDFHDTYADLGIYSNFGTPLYQFKIEGNVLDITSANICDDIVGEGDNDELVVLSENKDGYNFDLYEISQITAQLDKIDFIKLPEEETEKYLKIPEFYGEIIGIAGVRAGNILYPSKLRELDEIAILTNHGLYFRDEFVETQAVKITTGDLTNDRKDEIVLLHYDTLTVYEILGNKVFPIEKQLVTQKNVRTIFTRRLSVPVFAKGKVQTDIWAKGREMNGLLLKAQMSDVSYGTNTANRAVDGSFDTWAQAAADVPWDLTVDFGQPTEIKKVKLDLGTSFYAKIFKLEVSNDLETWQTVAEEKDGKGKTKTYEFEQVKARYFRLDVEESNGGGSGHSVREITFE